MLLELIILFIILVFVWDYLQILKLEKELHPIKITSRIPIIGSSLEMINFCPDNLHLKFHEYVCRFGKTFAGRAFGTTILVTAEPQHIEGLLSSQKHTKKMGLYYLLSPWLGNGLLLSYGSRWQKMRKIITPTFHFKILEQFMGVFDKQSNILVEKLQKFADGQTVVDIQPYMGLTTLDIIVETAMGVEVNAQDNEKSDLVESVNNVTEIMAYRFMQPHLAFPVLFRNFKPKLFARQKACIALMHRFTENIIRKRRIALQNVRQTASVPEDDHDVGRKTKHLGLLDVLLQAHLMEKPLTDNQICDEVNTFIFEGHDTTSTATSFCLYLLSRNPECQEKLYQEIREHFTDDRPIELEDLRKIDYLGAVIKESLRLYPPIPSIGRWLEDDFKLGDVTLPAGTNVIILIWELLRDPEFFPDPLTFKPERHLQNNANPNAFMFIPFSAGARNCIGQRFALLEMQTIIINILRRYELLNAGEDVHPSIKIVLKSSTGVNFALRPRIL